MSRRPVLLGWEDPTPYGYTAREAVEALQAALDAGLAFSWAGAPVCWDARTEATSLTLRITPDLEGRPGLEEAFPRSGTTTVFDRALWLDVDLEVEVGPTTLVSEYATMTFEPQGRDFRVTATLVVPPDDTEVRPRLPFPDSQASLLLSGRLEDGTATVDVAALFTWSPSRPESPCLAGPCPTLAVSPPDTDPVCDGCCSRYGG